MTQIKEVYRLTIRDRQKTKCVGKLVKAFLVVLFFTAVLSQHSVRAIPSGCNLTARSVGEVGTNCARPWFDANIHLNEIQFVGTAESYKLRPSSAVLSLVRMGSPEDVPALNFAEPPIPAQLDAGARSLQFDIAYDPKGGSYKYPAGATMAMELVSGEFVSAMSKPGFKVVHILDIDFNSSCADLTECLKAVANWSHHHSDHLPIVIVIKTNDERTPMPGATKPVKFDSDAFNKLDAVIMNVFRRSELVEPDDVQGKMPTLREAIKTHGWPTLGNLRGKEIFLLDDTPEKVGLYRQKRRNLEGRVMFVATDPKSSIASFVTVENPLTTEPAIENYVKSGLIVHTYSDAGGKEAVKNNTLRSLTAFGSGAQIISTDFIVSDPKISNYHVNLPNGLIARCNVLLQRYRCADHEGDLDAHLKLH